MDEDDLKMLIIMHIHDNVNQDAISIFGVFKQHFQGMYDCYTLLDKMVEEKYLVKDKSNMRTIYTLVK